MDSTAAPGAIPAAYRGQAARDAPSQPRRNTRPQPPQRAHRATQPGKGTGIQASTKTAPQSRQQAENRKPPEMAFTAPQSHETPPGVFLYYPARKNATEPPTALHRGKQSTAPETNTAGNARKSPTEPRRAGVLSLYYPPPKRRTGAYRAAHRGQAARGIETPGRASPQPPQPRRNTPSENPGVFR